MRCHLIFKKQISLIIPFLFLISMCDATDSSVTLKKASEGKYKIGTALNRSQIAGKDTNSVKLAIEQFNCITPENILKWEKVHPEPGKYDFAPADSLIAFAEKHDMLIIGHTLVWESQTPKWVFEDADGNTADRDTMLKRLKDHIFTVMGRYKGKIHGWDVINEAFDEQGNMKKTRWMKTIGEDYLHKAFEWAHEADPEAELYYNDYNMWYKGKREAVVKLVEDFRAKGIPIHGIGLQGHWGLDYPPNDELKESFATYAKLGLNIMVTELEMDMLPMPSSNTGADINLSFETKKELDPWPNGLPDSMQIVIANRYAEFFSIFNEYNESITRITVWGIHDGMSWRNNWPIPGRTAYPLLFGRNLKPNKAFYEVIKTIQMDN